MHAGLAPREWFHPKLSRETATVLALAVGDAVFGAVVLAATGSARHPTSTSTLFSGVVGGLYLTAGVIAHLRRRENRIGLLALAQLLTRGANGLDAALRELRELTRGIHPAVPSEAGLAAAVRALAARSPASVEVDVPERTVDALPPAVATTAYFVVAEAVTNALKHAHATTIRITLRRAGRTARHRDRRRCRRSDLRGRHRAHRPA